MIFKNKDMKTKKEILKIVSLLIGLVAITFSGINWYIGIAAWIAPVFLLLYTRKAKWYEMFIFFILISISGGISQTCNNLMNMPAVNISNGISYGILTVIPYIIDRLLYKKKDKFYYSLIFPVSIALIEFVASKAIGTWGSIAHTQYKFNVLIQLVSLTGIYGIWFIVSWFASVVNWIIENNAERRIIFKGTIIYSSIFLFILLFGVLQIKTLGSAEKTVKVATVLSETNIHQIMHEEAEAFAKLAEDNTIEVPARIFSDSLSINNLVKRIYNASQQNAKIIVWNETALILNKDKKKELISEIQSICAKQKVYVLLSFLEESEEQNKKPFNNISILVSPEKEILFEYKKSFLHPTAEAPMVNKGDFELPVAQTQYGIVGSVICSDLDIQNYIKQAGKKSVDILLVPAFDWAGITPLHSQMASLQAIQFGFLLVRSNGMGLSAIYDDRGNNLSSLNTFTSDDKIMYGEVPIQSRQTFYTRVGDILIYVCMVFLIVMIVKRFIKKGSGV